jgi:hypothetical protein
VVRGEAQRRGGEVGTCHSQSAPDPVSVDSLAANFWLTAPESTRLACQGRWRLGRASRVRGPPESACVPCPKPDIVSVAAASKGIGGRTACLTAIALNDVGLAGRRTASQKLFSATSPQCFAWRVDSPCASNIIRIIVVGADTGRTRPSSARQCRPSPSRSPRALAGSKVLGLTVPRRRSLLSPVPGVALGSDFQSPSQPEPRTVLVIMCDCEHVLLSQCVECPLSGLLYPKDHGGQAYGLCGIGKTSRPRMPRRKPKME